MKTVLITGSSRGIGRETALYFAQQGWNVIIHGFRHPEKLDSLKMKFLKRMYPAYLFVEISAILCLWMKWSNRLLMSFQRLIVL